MEFHLAERHSIALSRVLKVLVSHLSLVHLQVQWLKKVKKINILRSIRDRREKVLE